MAENRGIMRTSLLSGPFWESSWEDPAGLASNRTVPLLSSDAQDLVFVD